MRLEPGTFPWLLVHDLRLNWRRFTDMLGGARPRTMAAVLLTGGVLLHLAAWPVVGWLSPYIHSPQAGSGPITAFLVCTFTWMIAQSLFGATRTLYDRGDLDLLLGSPLTARRIFAAKAAAITASTLGSLAFLTLPIANMGALLDRTEWLGAYPTLIGLALIATSIAIVLSIGLFFLVGPRRARVYTQMTGVCIGGGFVLAAQIAAMLPASTRESFMGWIGSTALPGQSEARSVLSLPINALLGDVTAAMWVLVTGLVMFAAAVALFGERFARASIAANGASVGSNAASSALARHKFRSGIARSLRLKEWRCLARDHNLFAQLGLQIIYTIPIAVILLRSEMMPAMLALAPTIVLIAGQVAASLAWITVSGEDAPELIASAPVAPSAVDRAKLTAIALPLFTILALPLLGLAILSLKLALLTALFAAGAGASTALVNLWHPMPGNRRGMLRRHSQSKLIGLVEHALAIIWSFSIMIALIGGIAVLIPIGLVACVLWAWRTKYRTKSIAPRIRSVAARSDMDFVAVQ
jgi:ABC-2 type transport system permease protein